MANRLVILFALDVNFTLAKLAPLKVLELIILFDEVIQVILANFTYMVMQFVDGKFLIYNQSLLFALYRVDVEDKHIIFGLCLKKIIAHPWAVNNGAP